MFYLPFARFSLFLILSSSNVSFVSARTMATFRRSFYWQFILHDFLENLVTHECDLLLWLQSWWDFHTLPFIFTTFEGWHGAFLGDSEIIIGWTNISDEEGPAAARLPMLCPRLPTIAAWEGGATMTLCASGGLPCDVGSPISDGSSLGRRGPTAAAWEAGARMTLCASECVLITRSRTGH